MVFDEEDGHKIMGLQNMNVPQREIGGMEHHPEHRLMGIHPDAPEEPEHQVAAPHDDPFEQERYDNVNLPDAPVSYGGGIGENLINDNEVPKEFRKKFWWAFHKDLTLGFLDEGRKHAKMMSFDIAKIDILNSTPYYEYNFDKELEFTILRNVYETKLDRALGLKGGAGVKNERIMLQSQFTEHKNVNENGMDGNMKEGFFKRLMGRR